MLISCVCDFPVIYMYRIKRTTTEFELIPEQYGAQILLNNNDPRNSEIGWVENTDSDKEKNIKYRL